MKKNKTLIILLTLISCAPLFSEQPEHPLFKAAREGNTTEIKNQIENNENCAITDEQGNNLFHIAAEHGQSTIIEELTIELSWWQRWISGPTLPSVYEANKAGKKPVDIAIIKKKHSTLHYLLVAMKRNAITPDDQLKTLRMAIEHDDDTTLHLLDYHKYDLLLRDSNNNTLMHEAVIKHKTAALHYLARHTPLINAKNKNDEAPIVIAINNNDITMLQILGQHHADVNIAGKNGSRPLHGAKKPEVIDFLITLKALIDLQDTDGHTPLHYRIKDGNIPLINHLLSHGADVKKGNKQGKGAFSIALDSKNHPVIKLIAQHPDINVNERDHNGQTPFLRAAAEQNLSDMKSLIQYNVNTNIDDNFGENVFHKFAKNGYRDGALHMLSLNTSLLKNNDAQGRTPLMMATQYGWTSIALAYSEHGAPLNTQDNNNNTLLHEAAKIKNSVLLEHYLQKKAPILANKDHKFFYHYSAEKGDLEAIKLAKKYNVALNHCTPNNDTVLHLALKNNQLNCIPELLFPSMINYKNNDGVTPIALAVAQGDIKTIQLLINNGAIITVTDNKLRTLMHYTAETDKIDVFYLLEKKGLTALCADNNGNTPLHRAAQYNSLAIINYYKNKYPQTLDLRNVNNQTPFIFAACNGQINSTNQLLRESDFINKDINKAVEQARLRGHYEMANLLEKKINARIDHCKQVEKISIEQQNYIDNNKECVQWLANKGHHPTYSPSSIEHVSWQKLYTMKEEKRNKYIKHYSVALHNEKNINQQLHRAIDGIKQAEQRQAQERELKHKKEKEEQEAIEAQRIRVAEHKKKQEKLQHDIAAQKAQKQAQEALEAAQKQPNVPLVENTNNNDHAVEQEAAKCLICWDEDNLVPLPCARCKIGSGRIHQECIADLNGKCPICRGPLEK